MTVLRQIHKIIPSIPTQDGAGVHLRRSIGTSLLDHFDPFLLLDEISSQNADEYIAGFPSHPHRGFETVTYMLAGKMRHQDHTGAEGLLVPGGLQWMTAGRGIIHSEMPQQQEGQLWGFQLWVNLPAQYKMIPPRYQDISPDRIPEHMLGDGSKVRILAGEAFGLRGPVEEIVTDPIFLDIHLASQRQISFPVPEEHQALIYMYQDSGSIGGQEIAIKHLATLTKGSQLTLKAGSQGSRCLFIAAKPIAEPIARMGPFVMNTPEQIRQAIADYQQGRLT